MEFKKFVEKIAPLAELNSEEVEKLTTPNDILEADLEVNGKTYKAFRVQFNNKRGPYKGGIRFHPEVSKEEVMALAFWMTIKTTVANIPMGGGKGGVIVNPKDLNPEELEELSRAYVRAFHEKLGPQKDIPAPDVYTTPQIMLWMLDEFEKITGEKAPGMITGKPVGQGGSLVRDISTALGGVYVLEEAIKKLGLEGKTVAIQGFGNAGMNVAKLLSDRGFKIVAVSDSKGGIHDPLGLDVEQLMHVKKMTGSLTCSSCGDCSGCGVFTNKELLELPVDILIPSALGGQITAENAENVKAKIILELANGPTTEEADDILHKKDILVLPDILANAGGVVVSYFEWMQNNAGEQWTEEEVKEKLKKIMVEAFDRVWENYKDHDFRTTAYVYALNQLK